MYRVGNECFATKQAATDYQMSKIVPTIAADGSLYYPVKRGETWFYQGQAVDLSFGECNIEAEFYAGVKLAAIFVGFFAIAFVCKFTAKWLWAEFYTREPEQTES